MHANIIFNHMNQNRKFEMENRIFFIYEKSSSEFKDYNLKFELLIDYENENKMISIYMGKVNWFQIYLKEG